MAITKLKHHDKCQVRVRQCAHTSAHYASLHCVDCDTHIQWLNTQEAHTIAPLTNDVDFVFTRQLFTECNI